jgi:hypothetical protein
MITAAPTYILQLISGLRMRTSNLELTRPLPSGSWSTTPVGVTTGPADFTHGRLRDRFSADARSR